MDVDIASIIGARPQFVKCALVSRKLRVAGARELLIHTGQHYDRDMSDVFFEQLEIPEPDVNLGVGSGSHGRQTGEMLIRLEELFLAHRPRYVVVYGDTNSTLAGALAAVKLGIPVAHIESGLRSGNRAMPEEQNRVATDHWSSLLFCHNAAVRTRLLREGIGGRIEVVGDVMRELLDLHRGQAVEKSPYPRRLGVSPGEYAVLTMHRPVNTDDSDTLRHVVEWAADAPCPVIWPAHPRVHGKVLEILAETRLRRPTTRLQVISPLGYLDMLALAAQARGVITDSGGLQKEALFLGVPCITLRSETEWTETVLCGGDVLAGDRPAPEAISNAWDRSQAHGGSPSDPIDIDSLFGPPNPSELIVQTLVPALAAC